MPLNTFNLVSATNLPQSAAFRSDSEGKMILNNIGPPGDVSGSPGSGYAFTCWSSLNYKISATRYVPNTNNVAAQSTNHILARSLYDFALARTEPPSNRIFLLGGRWGTTFSNEYFAFTAAGFRTPSGIQVNPSNDPVDRMGAGLISGRAGITAVGITGNKILAFGGYNSGGMCQEVYEMGVPTQGSPTWTPKTNLPVPLKNAKALASGANGIVSWVYVVGGATSPNTETDNRKIFRYDVAADRWCKIQDANGIDIIIPGTRPLEIASLHGIYILTQSEDEQSMILYKLSHPNPSQVVLPSAGALGSAKGSVLTSKTRTLPTRARSHFALLRCHDDTWIIGGSTGHTPNLQNRGRFVDKLIP